MIDDPDASLLADPPRHEKLREIVHSADAGVALTSTHSSATGWYTLVTPSFSLGLSPRLSFDVSTPIYLWRLTSADGASGVAGPAAAAFSPADPGAANAQMPTAPSPAPTLTPHTWEAGDTFVTAHLNFAPGRLSLGFTPSLVLPTGDAAMGLSTGRVSFDIDQHVEFALRRGLTTLLDIGGGDASSVINPLVMRDVSSLGPLTHFQLGLAAPVALPLLRSRGATFSAVAYEQLPLGDAKNYRTVTDDRGVTHTVVTGRRDIEDNGFIDQLTLPLSPRLALGGFYNHSLRLHQDTAAVSLQFNLKPRRQAVAPNSDGIASLLR